ncbi:site-specific integrase [Roseivivax sp. THAF197b]|uniref:site-specific integrase n=1 Tax=Roseivivax sp. THAF197b TaxID=2588299 RepID=UPI0012678E2C|nr:site-specific integrase [Roseivivax sp. THAF197b]QFS82290.1 Phage integrase family protein [Roseivivax sp. THAF197b]
MTRTLPKGIFKRNGVYAVRFSVPTEAQSVVGKKEIVRSLGTRDLGEALARSPEVLSDIRENLFSAKVEKPQVHCRVSSGSTVRETAHRWLSESDGINNSTRARYRSILARFEEYSGNCDVSQIKREMALGFMDHLRATPSPKTGQPLSHRSLSIHQICLASYWRVLEHWGLVDGDMKNPFSSLLRRLAGQKKKTDPRKKNLRPVTREEAEALLAFIERNQRLKYQFEMSVTVRLLWVTACRLGEIAGLSLGNIDDRGDHIRLNITGAKTEAGNRKVMVVGQDDCELLRAAIRRAQVTEPACPDNRGLLFPRLLRGGYDRTPGHYLGKALENARKTLDMQSGEWDMHSFRRTGVSALVNAGVAKEARNLAVGHSNKDDIGMSVYAKRGDLSEVIKATFEALYGELGGSL